MSRPFAPTPDGVRLAVRLTPKARCDEIQGVGADADGRAVLLVRLAAPPIEGEANRALVRYLARRLGVRQAQVEIASGASSRTKMLRLRGDPAALVASLEALLQAHR
jgi:hypothetical protein